MWEAPGHREWGVTKTSEFLFVEFSIYYFETVVDHR